jgi:hypothetical protein
MTMTPRDPSDGVLILACVLVAILALCWAFGQAFDGGLP